MQISIIKLRNLRKLKIKFNLITLKIKIKMTNQGWFSLLASKIWHNTHTSNYSSHSKVYGAGELPVLKNAFLKNNQLELKENALIKNLNVEEFSQKS